jgi:hypothetical protein
MATSDGGETSFFARYIDSPAEKERLRVTNASPAEKLLDWIMNFWMEDTLTARDICALGPNPTRDRKKAFEAAEILVKRGCLAPVKAHRRDSCEWKIVWKSSAAAASVQVCGVQANDSSPRSRARSDGITD